jgi:transposase
VLSFSTATRIYLVAGVTDMRKSYNGLAAIVEHHLVQDPLSGHVYIFCNRRRDRVKLLLWDGSGLWVCAKRLEKGTFAWPRSNEKAVQLTGEELTLLVGGIDLRGTTKRDWYGRTRSNQANERMRA